MHITVPINIVCDVTPLSINLFQGTLPSFKDNICQRTSLVVVHFKYNSTQC